MGDCAISWSSKKAAIVTLSSYEFEYVATTPLIPVMILRVGRFLKELPLPQEEATKIGIDNKSAHALAKNLMFHHQSKHINTRYHFIEECIGSKEVELKYLKTHYQVANIFMFYKFTEI